jgi:arginase
MRRVPSRGWRGLLDPSRRACWRPRLGSLSPIHVDGHSDFRRPGNYDSAAALGAVAGMDLALATGRGEALLIDRPALPRRSCRTSRWCRSASAKRAMRISPGRSQRDRNHAHRRVYRKGDRHSSVIERTDDALDRTCWPFWLHFDVDALDQRSCRPSTRRAARAWIRLISSCCCGV